MLDQLVDDCGTLSSLVSFWALSMLFVMLDLNSVQDFIELVVCVFSGGGGGRCGRVWFCAFCWEWGLGFRSGLRSC